MQKKNSFDQETLVKIGKGAIIAAVGAGALYILSVVGTLKIDTPVLASFIAWIVPVATNAVKEYMKGEKVEVPAGATKEETPETPQDHEPQQTQE